VSVENVELAKVCTLFGLGDLASSRRAGGTRNTSFIINTTEGAWLIRKRYAGYAHEDRVRFDHSVLRFMAEQNVPVAAPLRAPDSKTWLRNGDDVWEAYPFIEGDHLRDGDPAEACALGRTLGRFHRAGTSFDLDYEKLGPRGETDPDHLLEALERIKSGYRRRSEALEYYGNSICRAREELTMAEFAALPHTLVHGDVQPANILMRDGEVAALVDLDWTCRRPRIYDIGWAILTCCARHDSPIGAGDVWSLSQAPRFDRDTVRMFISAYENAHTPLTADEINALPPQLLLSWCHVRIGCALKTDSEQMVSILENEFRLEPDFLAETLWR